MSLITDLVDTLQKTVKVLSADIEGMAKEELAAHEKKVAEALWGVADNISSLAGVPDFSATDPMTAAAVGGASGLAATGADQIVKQLAQ